MAERTIVLKGDPLQKEAQANAAITPGHLIEMMSTGKVRKHATSGGNVLGVMVAIENSLQGEDIDVDYSANDMCQYVEARPGDEMYMWLADLNDISIGDSLESNGDGTLKKHTPPVESSGYSGTEYLKRIVARANEALNLASTSYLTATRIKVTIV